MTRREFRELFPEFRAPSWAAWNAIEDATHGVEPSDAELVRRVTGRRVLPSAQVSECWIVGGRGSGKSRFAGNEATYFGCGRRYVRAPGERIFVVVVAPDRKQAALTFGYIEGLIDSVPALAALVVNRTRDSIDLSTGVTIEVITASAAAPRGRSYALVIIEEAAFLPSDTAAEPDVELLRAVRPGLARVPGSLLIVVSSPFARRGELYRVWRDRFGVDDDDVLVVVADTATLNPAFSRREIERAFRSDPVAAASEDGRDGSIRFRDDVSAFVANAAIAAVVPAGVRELQAGRPTSRFGHFDAAGGSGDAESGTGDAAAAAVAEEGLPARLAAVRRWPPPFNPSDVVAEAAALFHRFGVYEITIDRYAPGLVMSLFRSHGIDCRVAERDTSGNFAELLALVNSGRVTLLDEPVLLRELSVLERRPGASGREQIGHPARGHDDVAAAAAGALVQAASVGAEPPLMILGGSGYRQWQAEHGAPEAEPSPTAASAESEHFETDALGLLMQRAGSTLSGLRASATARWEATQLARSERAEANAARRRSTQPGVLDVLKAVAFGTAQEAKQAAEAMAEGSVERERRKRAAAWMEDRVKRGPARSWFPSD